MNETKQKGLLTELHCQVAFSQLGILLSAPICQDSRYDFIADIQGQLIKIQCKTCSVLQQEQGIVFATRSTRVNTHDSYQRYYTKEQIDYFYTYYDGKSYLVKVEETSSQKTLRFWSEYTNQPNISWAKDYELQEVLKKDFNFNSIKIQPNIKSKNKQNFCIDCGAPISSKAIRCVHCSHKQFEVLNHPTREELKSLIRTIPFVQIGKMYNVSDKAVVKWCVQEKLPSKKSEIKKISDEDWKKI